MNVNRTLERSKNDRIVFGVCGGIAKFLNVETIIIRIILIFTILIGGWGIIAYLIAFFLMPEDKYEEENDPEKLQVIDSANSKTLFGGILLIIGFFFTFNIYGIIQYFSFIGMPTEIFWSLIMVSSGFIFIFKKPFVPILNPSIEFYRTNKDSRIAGICSGLAEYMGTDSNMIRALWLILSFITIGFMVLIYILIWVVVPLKSIEND